jgi:flagellar motility protein MotE (MotC chaperone)
MRSIRLLPVVILTSMMLLGLKGFNLLVGPGNTVIGVENAVAQAADEGTAAEGEDAGDMSEDAMAQNSETGEEAGMATEDPTEAAQAMPEVENQDQSMIDFPVQSSREALLERLGERRVVIEELEQDLRVREQLLEAAERRLEQRMAELEALEARVTAAADAEDERESEEIARLVQVYSAMRAKDAAAIFDLLDLPILMEVANAMNPRKMADILGEMTPESARQLTIALAGESVRVPVETQTSGGELPRIDGVPIQ